MVQGGGPTGTEQALIEILAYLKRLAAQIPNFDQNYKKVYKKIKAIIEANPEPPVIL